jgi:hypothetical protein
MRAAAAEGVLISKKLTNFYFDNLNSKNLTTKGLASQQGPGSLLPVGVLVMGGIMGRLADVFTTDIQ